MSSDHDSVIACLGEGLAEIALQVGSEAAALGPGGDAANTAVMAARLGARSRLLGCVGDDALGRRLVAFWAEAGVDTAAVVVDPRAPTGIYVNELGADGAHRFDYHRSGSAGGRYAPGDVAASPLGDVGVLHITGISLSASAELARSAAAAEATARSVGARVSVAANHRPRLRPDPDLLRAALGRADIAFLSLEDGLALYGTDDPVALAGRLDGPAEVVLTLGARGAVAWAGDTRHEQAAPRVDAVDAAGAGDALAGAYLASRLLGHDVPAALARAVAAAALSTRRRGCAASYPRAQELEEALATS